MRQGERMQTDAGGGGMEGKLISSTWGSAEGCKWRRQATVADSRPTRPWRTTRPVVGCAARDSHAVVETVKPWPHGAEAGTPLLMQLLGAA